MSRIIDPWQLMDTLGPLLTPEGGIKSYEEARRLTQLMQRFSQKMVTKCIYIQVLKNTDQEILEEFLRHTGREVLIGWLSQAIRTRNWPLCGEMVSLLAYCPILVDRIRDNMDRHITLIDALRQDTRVAPAVRALAGDVYDKWNLALSTARDERASQGENGQPADHGVKAKSQSVNSTPSHSNAKTDANASRFKSDGIAKDRDILRKKIHLNQRTDLDDKERKAIKDVARRLRAEQQLKKDKETLKKLSGNSMTAVISKMPKIPKRKTDSNVKGSPLSGTKPNTVRTPLNRNKTAALLQEIPRPLSEVTTSPTLLLLKRPHSSKSTEPPPNIGNQCQKLQSMRRSMQQGKEVKLKAQESPLKKPNLSETPVKKKRRLAEIDLHGKSKNVDHDNSVSLPVAFSFYRDTLQDSPNHDGGHAKQPVASATHDPDLCFLPPESRSASISLNMTSSADSQLQENDCSSVGNKRVGILVDGHGLVQRQSKKSVRWQPEPDLVKMCYFELDNGERVNVHKLKFEEMCEAELKMEKAAFKREAGAEGEEGALQWCKPIRIEVDNKAFIPRLESLEKDVQADRERTVLQALYFTNEMIPSTPSDPKPEYFTGQLKVTIIPFEDTEAGPDSDFDYGNVKWPEPNNSQGRGQPAKAKEVLHMEKFMPHVGADANAGNKLANSQGNNSIWVPPTYNIPPPDFPRMSGGQMGPPHTSAGYNNYYNGFQPPGSQMGPIAGPAGLLPRRQPGSYNRNFSPRPRVRPERGPLYHKESREFVHGRPYARPTFHRESRSNLYKYKTVPCSFFNGGQGYCRDGDRCTYRHDHATGQ